MASSSRSHDAADASLGFLRSGDGEDDWVDAEIERLLHSAIEDDDNGEEDRLPMHVQVKDHPGDQCVSNLFSAYLSTVGSQQSDVQSLLSDAYTTLATATDLVMKNSNEQDSIEQQCDEPQCKLTKREENIGIEQSNVNATKFENTTSVKTILGQPQTDYSRTESIAKQKLTEMETQESHLPTNVNYQLVPDGRMQILPTRQSREVETCDRDGPAEIDDVSVNVFCEPVGVGVCQENGGVGVELQAVLDQMEAEQRRSEEQLAKDQKEREAEIASQIEEAHRMIAEYQKAEMERMMRSEQVKHQSAVIIQAYWRGYLVQRVYRDKLLHMKQIREQRIFKAAQILQAIWRGCSIRRYYAPILEAKTLARLQQEAMTKNLCATRIQRCWRGYWIRQVHGPALAALREKRISEALIKKEEMHKKSVFVATHLQAMWRGYLMRKKYRPLLNKRMEEWRKEKSIQRYNAATQLQACWKGRCVRQRLRPLLQERNARRTLEKQQAKAAVVLQAYWRGLSSRIRYIRRQKEESSPNVVLQASNDACIEIECASSNCEASSKLTVTEYHQSPVKSKLQQTPQITDMSVNDTESNPRASVCASQGGGMMQGGGSDVVLGEHRAGVVRKMDLEMEQHAIKSLMTSRDREKAIADQSRLRIGRAMTHWDAEKASHETQSDSSYQTELNHSSTSLSPQVWLDVVQCRLRQWALSMTPWKEPHPPDHVHPAPIPTARVKQRIHPLSNAQILAASPRNTPVNKVTKVVVHEYTTAPDVSSLSVCPKLCSFTLIKCNLRTLASLHLPLMDLTLQSNALEQADFESVCGTLSFLDLSENRLCSIHGLDKCACLLCLDISGNRITRLGGLGGCWRLQSLKADCNLLVSCPGLEGLPNLQTLCCTQNHLPSLPGLHNCSLLTSLHLQQNNLQEIPQLPHHVVLRELRLEENSLSSVSPLCQAWLPLLQILSVAGNCITELDSLVPFIMLHTLDISNNSIYDLPRLLQSLQGCMELCSLSLHGNPVGEEPQVLSFLLSTLPSLEIVNDQPLPRCKQQNCELSDLVTCNAVYKLCKKQLSEQDAMKKKHTSSIEILQSTTEQKPQDVKKLLEMKVDHCKQYECLLVRHIREQEELGRQCLLESSEQNLEMMKSHIKSSMLDVPDSAAVVLQSAWRGRVVRQSLAALRHSVIIIQAAWRGVLFRRKAEEMMNSQQKKCWAATIIQATYRGYWVRNRLKDLMQGSTAANETDDSLEEDIDLNLLDDDLLEDDMSPLSPCTPTSPPEIHHTQHITGHSTYSQQCNIPVEEEQQRSTVMPEVPLKLLKREHQNEYQPITDPAFPSWSSMPTKNNSSGIPPISSGTEEGPKLLPSQAWNEDNLAFSHAITPSHLAHDETVKKTHKETIVDEWGFKTDATAHLLLKRARRQKRFKSKAEMRKKMADPAERLAAFQKQGQSDTICSVAQRCDHKQQTFQHTRRKATSLMYQWSHDHTMIHKDSLGGAKIGSQNVAFSKTKKDTTSHNQPSSTQATSEFSLPQLDHRVLAGHAPSLVACDTVFKPRSSFKSFQDDVKADYKDSSKRQ